MPRAPNMECLGVHEICQIVHNVRRRYGRSEEDVYRISTLTGSFADSGETLLTAGRRRRCPPFSHLTRIDVCLTPRAGLLQIARWPLSFLGHPFP